MNDDASDSEPASSEPAESTIDLAKTNQPEDEVRVGSPFAVDPVLANTANRPIEVLYDVGPIRYTAMGAVAASIMVVGFGTAAAFWFPSGGALIAALGCVLSIFGLYSHYRYVALGLLTLHLCLFVYSYGQSLS